ncbi:hypothetical protein [Micromonospora zhanjiangensis]
MSTRSTSAMLRIIENLSSRRTPRSTLSTQLLDLPSRSASICWLICRLVRHCATRRPMGSSSSATPPPPVGDGSGGFLDRYPVRLG